MLLFLLLLLPLLFAADTTNPSVIKSRTQAFLQGNARRIGSNNIMEKSISLTTLLTVVGSEHFPDILMQQILILLLEQTLSDTPMALPEEGIVISLGSRDGGWDLTGIKTSPAEPTTGPLFFAKICSQLTQFWPTAHFSEFCRKSWSKGLIQHTLSDSMEFLHGVQLEHFQMLWALILRILDMGMIPRKNRLTLEVISAGQEYHELLRALDQRSYSIRDRQVGQGGFGQVHLVKDWEDNAPKALKILQLKSTNLSVVNREIQAMRLLQGASNVIQLHAAYLLQPDQVGLEMELLNGLDGFYFINFVARLYPTWPYIPMKMLAAIIREIALGLKEIHSRGLIHSDLKWENVQIGEDGRVTILDLGLAAKLSAVHVHGTTRCCAPPEYFAVHLANKVLKPDPSFDVFQLGMMLYTILAESEWSEIILTAKDLPSVSVAMGDKFSHDLLSVLPEKIKNVAKAKERKLLETVRTFFLQTMNPHPCRRPTIENLLQMDFIAKGASRAELQAWILQVMPELLRMKQIQDEKERVEERKRQEAKVAWGKKLAEEDMEIESDDS